jgi:hypothetical protein
MFFMRTKGSLSLVFPYLVRRSEQSRIFGVNPKDDSKISANGLRLKEVAEGNLGKSLIPLLSAVSRFERSEDKATKLPQSSGAKSLFIIP